MLIELSKTFLLIVSFIPIGSAQWFLIFEVRKRSSVSVLWDTMTFVQVWRWTNFRVHAARLRIIARYITHARSQIVSRFVSLVRLLIGNCVYAAASAKYFIAVRVVSNVTGTSSSSCTHVLRHDLMLIILKRTTNGNGRSRVDRLVKPSIMRWCCILCSRKRMCYSMKPIIFVIYRKHFSSGIFLYKLIDNCGMKWQYWTGQ